MNTLVNATFNPIVGMLRRSACSHQLAELAATPGFFNQGGGQSRHVRTSGFGPRECHELG